MRNNVNQYFFSDTGLHKYWRVLPVATFFWYYRYWRFLPESLKVFLKSPWIGSRKENIWKIFQKHVKSLYGFIYQYFNELIENSGNVQVLLNLILQDLLRLVSFVTLLSMKLKSIYFFNLFNFTIFCFRKRKLISEGITKKADCPCYQLN